MQIVPKINAHSESPSFGLFFTCIEKIHAVIYMAQLNNCVDYFAVLRKP
jgi:hypothetical protein